jgi:hypothetical protein
MEEENKEKPLEYNGKQIFTYNDILPHVELSFPNRSTMEKADKDVDMELID